MSDKKLGKQHGNARRSTRSFGNDNPRKSPSRVPTTNLTPRNLSEHNNPPMALPSRRKLRKLIVSVHARTSPKESQKLPYAELSRLVRNADLFLRRLRRLALGGRRFMDLEPMLPLQEAIAQELANQLGFQTRFYDGPSDSRYMVAYKPGVEPNAFEKRARRMCQKDKDEEIYVVKEDNRMEPMFFQDGRLHWHQPMEWGDNQKAADPQNAADCHKEVEPVQVPVSLGRQILMEFNRDHQAENKPELDQKDIKIDTDYL